MGLFDWFGKKEKIQAQELEIPQSHLAFVLLREPTLPSAAEIVTAFEEFRGPDETLSFSAEADQEKGDGVLVFDMEGFGTAFVALMPAAVPKGEAESAFPFSLSAFAGDTQLEPHEAHLIVSLQLTGGVVPVEGLLAFTSLVAAVTKASPATGVYWGNAGATHTAKFVLDLAAEHGIMPRIMLWNGLSRGRESGGRVSLLSRGMNQLGLADLYLIVRMENGGAAIERIFDLLAYAAERGAVIGDGETVGATAEERIVVRHVKSPAQNGAIVWSLEM